MEQQKFNNFFELTDGEYISNDKLLKLNNIYFDASTSDGVTTYYIKCYFTDDNDRYRIIKKGIPDKESAELILFAYLAKFDEAISRIKNSSAVQE